MIRKIISKSGAVLCAALFALLLITGCPRTTDTPKPSNPSGPLLTITATGGVAELRILTLDKALKKGTFEDQMKAPGAPVTKGKFEIVTSGGSKKFKISEATDPSINSADDGYEIGSDNKVMFSFHEYDLTPLLNLLN